MQNSGLILLKVYRNIDYTKNIDLEIGFIKGFYRNIDKNKNIDLKIGMLDS